MQKPTQTTSEEAEASSEPCLACGGAGFNLQLFKKKKSKLFEELPLLASFTASLEKKGRVVCSYPENSFISLGERSRGPRTGLGLMGTLVRTRVISSTQTKKDRGCGQGRKDAEEKYVAVKMEGLYFPLPGKCCSFIPATVSLWKLPVA